MILNLGCGDDDYGDVRVDWHQTRGSTEIADLSSILPYQTESFDEVYSENLLEHLPNPGLFIQEASRVCKRGSIVKVITDNAGWWRYSLPKKLLTRNESFETLHGCYRGADPSDRHYQLFEPDHLRNHLESAGLVVLEMEYIAIASKRKKGIVSRMYYALIGIITMIDPVSKHLLYPQLSVSAMKK